jgi:hypothetical protein
MAANIGEGRVLRVCDLCGGVDDHPRHVIAGTEERAFPKPSDEILQKVIAAAPTDDVARLVGDLVDTTSSDRHLDCCASAGCPTGTCAPQVAGAPGAGRKMLDHLVNQADPFADRADVVKAS